MQTTIYLYLKQHGFTEPQLDAMSGIEDSVLSKWAACFPLLKMKNFNEDEFVFLLSNQLLLQRIVYLCGNACLSKQDILTLLVLPLNTLQTINENFRLLNCANYSASTLVSLYRLGNQDLIEQMIYLLQQHYSKELLDNFSISKCFAYHMRYHQLHLSSSDIQLILNSPGGAELLNPVETSILDSHQKDVLKQDMDVFMLIPFTAAQIVNIITHKCRAEAIGYLKKNLHHYMNISCLTTEQIMEEALSSKETINVKAVAEKHLPDGPVAKRSAHHAGFFPRDILPSPQDKQMMQPAAESTKHQRYHDVPKPR